MTHYRDAKDFCGNAFFSFGVAESASDHRREIGSCAVTGSVDEIWIASDFLDVVEYLNVSFFSELVLPRLQQCTRLPQGLGKGIQEHDDIPHSLQLSLSWNRWLCRELPIVSAFCELR